MEPDLHPESPTSFRSWRGLGYGLLAAFLVATVYFIHLDYDPASFSSGDNQEAFSEVKDRNTLLKKFDFTLNTGRPAQSSYYMPMVSVVLGFLLDHFQDRPEPCFRTSILLLAISTFLCFLIFREIIGNDFIAFMTSMSFGLFLPTFATVSYLCFGLSIGVISIFCLSSLYCFIKYVHEDRRIWYYISLILFFGACLSKVEWTLSLIPTMCLYYLLFKRKGPWLSLQKGDLLLLPHLAGGLAVFMIDLCRLKHSTLVNVWGGFNFGVHTLYRFFDLMSFLITIVPVANGFKMMIVVGILFSLPILVHFARKDSKLLFFACWTGMAILPYVFSNFRWIYTLGRYLYFPSIGWYGLLYYATTRIENRPLRILFTGWVILYSVGVNLLLLLGWVT